MNSRCIARLSVREDKRYDGEELQRSVVDVKNCNSIRREQLIAAFKVLSSVVEEGLKATGLRDVRPPNVVRDIVYTGQLVGNAAVELKDSVIIIELRPKLKAYRRLVEELNDVLNGLGLTPCVILARAFLAGVPGLDPFGAILALKELVTYAERGTPMQITGGKVTLNRRYFSTIIASLATIVRSYRKAGPTLADRMTVGNLIASAIRSPPLMKVVDVLDEVFADPQPDIDYVLYVSTIARSARLIGERKELKLVQLQPTPRIYELYVLARLIRLLNHGRKVVQAYGPCSTIIVDVNSKIYYHSVPPGASRIVEKLSRRHPEPDLLVEREHERLIVEAKYRALNRIKLTLADALRLAGYIIDLSDQKSFKAVIAHINRNYWDYVKVDAAGTSVGIVLAPFHPDVSDSMLERLIQI